MADALSRTPVYFDYDQDKPKTLDFDAVRSLYLSEGADEDGEYCRPGLSKKPFPAVNPPHQEFKIFLRRGYNSNKISRRPAQSRNSYI